MSREAWNTLPPGCIGDDGDGEHQETKDLSKIQKHKMLMQKRQDKKRAGTLFITSNPEVAEAVSPVIESTILVAPVSDKKQNGYTNGKSKGTKQPSYEINQVFDEEDNEEEIERCEQIISDYSTEIPTLNLKMPEKSQKKLKQKNDDKINRNDSRDSNSDNDSNEASGKNNLYGDMHKYVWQPMPPNFLSKCRVTRDKHGLDKGMYPTYYLHQEQDNGEKLFLLAARKRKKSKTSNYLISLDPTDLSREGASFVGKVRANMIGTQFTIFGFDKGKNADEKYELAAVIYDMNVLGFKGPRKMTVIIPGMNMDQDRIEVRPKKKKVPTATLR